MHTRRSEIRREIGREKVRIPPPHRGDEKEQVNCGVLEREEINDINLLFVYLWTNRDEDVWATHDLAIAGREEYSA